MCWGGGGSFGLVLALVNHLRQASSQWRPMCSGTPGPRSPVLEAHARSCLGMPRSTMPRPVPPQHQCDQGGQGPARAGHHLSSCGPGRPAWGGVTADVIAQWICCTAPFLHGSTATHHPPLPASYLSFHIMLLLQILSHGGVPHSAALHNCTTTRPTPHCGHQCSVAAALCLQLDWGIRAKEPRMVALWDAL